MDGAVRIERHRKFHDAWAAILYAMLSIAVITGGIIHLFGNASKAHDILKDVDFGLNEALMAAFVGLLVLMIELSICFLLLLYFPKTVIYVAAVLLHVLGPIITVMFFSPTRLTVSIILHIFSLVFFFSAVRPNIVYICTLISIATRIITMYLFQCMVFLLTSSMVVAAQASMCMIMVIKYAHLDDNKNVDKDTSMLLLCFSTIMALWTVMARNYMFQVFVSALAAGHIDSQLSEEGEQQREKSVVGAAMRYTVYAAGSVCFGSLIIALMRAARLAIENHENNRQKSERENSLLGTVFLWIALILLYLLEDMVEAINQMVFSYIALHGTPFRESISFSWAEVTKRHGRGLGAMLGVSVALAFFIIIFMVSLGFLCTIPFAHINSITKSTANITAFIGLLAIPTIIFDGAISMVRHGVQVLVYMHIECPDAVKEYDGKLSGVIQAQPTTIGNVGSVEAE